MKPYRVLIISCIVAMTAALASAGSAGGGSSGGAAGTGSGSTGLSDSGTATINDDAGGSGSGSTTETGEPGRVPADPNDDSGILAPNNDASLGDFDRGDSAPRTEPDRRDDRLNTQPRVAPEPADEGGAGSTSGETETGADDTGTINDQPVPVPDDAGVSAPRTGDNVGDRSLTREPNGTAGSRAPETIE